jgi:hypothetical protein
MPRRYIVPAEQLSLTAASDIIQISGATGKMLRIIRWAFRPADNTLATAQVLSTRCRFLPATVTVTGGTSVTPQKIDPGDAAASFTATKNNTTKTTTGGTAVTVDVGGGHIYNGYEQQPEKEILVGPSEAFVFELLSSAIQGTVTVNAEVEVEELGG